MSHADLTSFDDKENSCWGRGTLDLRLTKAQAPIVTEGHKAASTSSSILSITARGLGGLPMGRPTDDVEGKRGGTATGNVAVETVTSTDLPFEFSQSSSFFSFSGGECRRLCLSVLESVNSVFWKHKSVFTII